MKFLSDLLVQGDGNEIFLKSADHNISRIIPRGTGANLDKGLFSLYDTGTEDVRIDTAGNSWFNGGQVGIGTNNPSYKLHVQGSANGNVNTAVENTSTGTNAYASYRLKNNSISTAVLFLNGSNNTAYAGANSLNMYQGGDHPLGFVTNNNTRMVVTGGGNVGIGTTSPAYKLHVDGQVKIQSTNYEMLYLHQADAFGGFIKFTNTDDTSGWYTGIAGTEKFIISRTADNSSPIITAQQNGNVGIGTDIPSTKLHVKEGNANILIGADDTYGANYSAIGFGGLTNGFNRIFAGFDGSAVYDDMYYAAGTGKGHQFRTNGSGGTKVIITSAGNVGIGTTSPSQKLHVAGKGLFTDFVRFNGVTAPDFPVDIDAVDGGKSLRSTRGTSVFRIDQGNDGPGYIGMQSADDFSIQTNNTSKIYITSAGNVGVGTTSPQAALHVAGAFNSTAPTGNGVLMGFYSSSHGYIQLNGPSGGYIDFSTSGTDHKGRLLYDNTSNYMRFDTNGSEKMRINSAGNVGIGTTAPAQKLEVAGNIKIGDSNVMYFGAGDDLKIFHNATDSFIINEVGDLKITNGANDKDIIFQSDDGSGGVTNYIVIDGSTTENVFYKNAALRDSVKATFGNSNDLQIYHDGTGSNIDNSTGHLTFTNYANDSHITFKSDDGSGGVETYFYLNGVTGYTEFTNNVHFVDNTQAWFGNSGDLKIYHDGSNSYIKDAGSGGLRIASDLFRVYKADLSGLMINAVPDDRVELYFNDNKKFETTSTGVAVTGKITNLTAGTGNLDAVNVQQLNNATTGTLIYKGTWSAAPTTTSVLDGAVSSAGTIVIDAVNPGISVGATITGTGISGTVTVSNIAADGITIAISSAQTIADGTTLTFTTVGGTPDLSQASRKVTGHYYICETAGAVTPNGAGTTPNEWAVGDWATFSDLTTDAWQKIDNSSVLSGAGTGGKVPVWSGTGTSVTLADAPITVSGNNATFAGNVAMATGNATGKFAVKSTGVHASYDFYNNGTSYFNGGVVVDAGLSQTGGADVTFTGDVNMASAKIESDGSAAAGAYLELHHNNNDTTDVCATINLTNNAGGYASIIGGTTGANNTGYIEFKTDNAGTQGTVLTLNGDNSATFAGANTYNKVQTYYSGSYISGWKFSDYNGGIWYDASADDLTINAGHANSQMLLNSGGAIALTLDASQNATFAGNVELGDSSNISMSNAAPGQLQIQGSGYTGAIALNATAMYIYHNSSLRDLVLGTNETARLTINGSTGNATFAGNVTLESTSPVLKIDATGTGNPEIFFTRITGDDQNAKIRLLNNQLAFENEGDPDSSFLFQGRAAGAGSLSDFLKIEDTGITAPGATFGGNVTLSSTAPVLYLANTTSSTGKTWRFSSAANGNAYITQDGVIDAITLSHTSGNATFAGAINSGTITSTGIVKAATTFQATGGDMTFYVNNVGEAMRVQQNTGEVGIGTTDPKSKLHVNGGIQMAGDTAAASADKVGTMRYRTGTEYVEVNGTELVTNGDFAADSNWTKGTGTTISGGKANFSNASGVSLYQDVGASSNYVKVTFSVTDYTSGGLKIYVGGYSIGTSLIEATAVGDYSVVMNASSGNGNIIFGSSNNFTGSIDNVSAIAATAEDASYADMCMQTGSSTYEWVNIVRNTY